jgi:hypothetical protein
MAYIAPFNGNRWRVQIERHGIRKSRLFKTEEDARKWASEVEAMAGKDVLGYFEAKRWDLAQTALTTKIPPRVLEANHVIPYKHDEILAAGVPSKLASGIYFLIKADEVVYVGQSLDTLHRIARHRREGRDFDRYACLECSPSAMDELEAHYIAAFAPRYNMSFGRKSQAASSAPMNS